MEQYITLSELSMITGLTDRTLRTYLKMNILSGEKIDGVWKFTEEDVNEFLTNKTVKPSIQAKKNAVVYDFLREDKKAQNEICLILDIQDRDKKKVSEFFCAKSNEVKGPFKFSLEAEGKNIRVILRGLEEVIFEILQEYYGK